jgi:hypothetical protein
MEVSGQLHAPAALSPGEELVPIGQEAEWAPEPVRTRWWGTDVNTVVKIFANFSSDEPRQPQEASFGHPRKS